VSTARYDAIGLGYAAHRRADPRIVAVVLAALDGARTVVNVGAGAGSYEPEDRLVVPVDPSAVMLAQRPPHRPAGVLGRAERLPLRDGSVDAAMTVLSLHHWDDQPAGLAEMVRVARRRVVVLTLDPLVSGRTWLLAEHLPEVAALDRRIMPAPARLAARPGGRVQVVPVPADCTDLFLVAAWARPERLLDPAVRAATSGFARMPAEVAARAVRTLRADLASGEWDRRHGHLRALAQLDVGLRLVSADLR
jgi:SAM-dependent methyltransferase